MYNVFILKTIDWFWIYVTYNAGLLEHVEIEMIISF